MKTYKVKNYKGNLVESLKKFSDSHKGMKIVEACEDKDELKIKAEESEKLEEAAGKKCWVVLYRGQDDFHVLGICDSKQEAEKIYSNLKYSEKVKDIAVRIEEYDINVPFKEGLLGVNF